ncbi:uncharacterized protein LOC142492560 isoform X3 [Ascaphus truei]|uniref:uncharacterized protein LOC142492560 isoform X3 n=1 Tax=Ascaphus truei TaxID=8439 RepID=UPI003F59A95B
MVILRGRLTTCQMRTRSTHWRPRLGVPTCARAESGGVVRPKSLLQRMPRGELWLPEELKVLFKVVQDSCDLDILMSSRHANAVEWEPIAREMVRHGFRRTWQQCRAKWKALRRAFHLENEHKLLHGTHSDKRPPSYSIMLKMWQKAGRPVFRDQHMLRTRNHHLQITPGSREGRNSFCSISHAPVQEAYAEDEDIKAVILLHDVGSPSSNADSSPILCEDSALFSRTPEEFELLHPQVTTLEHQVLHDDEDIKPVILHHIPETPRSDTESSSDKCQELQLLETLVMQQKEIITRLDFLNHNLVQMASLHYQHMGESSADSIKTGSQDSAAAGNQPTPFPPMFIPFPTPTSTESSALTTYISAPQPPASYIHYSQSPVSFVPSFQIPATYIPSSQSAAAYIPSSQIPSTLYAPTSKTSSTFFPTFSPISASSPRPTSHPSTHRNKIL